MSWSERVLVRDGVRLVARDFGGPNAPVVLLHGLAGNAGEWDMAAEQLSPRYRVVALDQRGHGASERRPADVSRAAFVADVVALIEQSGLHRPVLVGQSLGGHTAMLTAAAHPGLLRALVLVEAGAGGPNPPSVATGIAAWLDSWPVPFATLRAAEEFFTGQQMPAAWASGLQERDGRWWPSFERDVMVECLAENATRSWWSEWARIDCPTLLVLGERGIIPAADIDQMLRLRPDTVATTVPAAGHDLHLEQPDALHAVLTDFLDGLA
jgi:pimeloyl-ACP methyl ester carboxylesterase